MKYDNTTKGIFIKRITRFTAEVEVGGRNLLCHVKNTGRLGELFQYGAAVFLAEAANSERKTKYDIICVEKNGVLFNVDSIAPNKVAGEFLPTLFPAYTLIRPEVKHLQSRFDFYIETDKEKAFLEVKGVTLEKDGTAMFPDAPTERGVKHVKELAECANEGFGAYILFLLQFSGAKKFVPNTKTDMTFAKALAEAKTSGVKILAYECNVSPDSMSVGSRIPVDLTDI